MIYDNLGPFTPQDRAQAITERLARLAKDPFTRIYPVTAVDREATSELVYGETVVMTVTDRDAQPTGKTRSEIAKAYAEKIHAALAKSREEGPTRTILIDAGLLLLDTAILAGLLFFFHKTFPKMYAKIQSWRGTVIRPVRIQRVELLSAGQITETLIGLTKTVRVGAVLVLLYLYLTTALGIFPWTRDISTALVEAVLATLRAIGEAFATYIPNLVSIAIIIVVTRYIIKLISLVFTGIERGAITFVGFHRDWAEPTYKIVRFLVVVFAAIAIFPYIPGSQSEGFRGISVFLGLLISLGSAAAVGNVVAGVVLTCMRPFRLGNRSLAAYPQQQCDDRIRCAVEDRPRAVDCRGPLDHAHPDGAGTVRIADQLERFLCHLRNQRVHRSAEPHGDDLRGAAPTHPGQVQ